MRPGPSRGCQDLCSVVCEGEYYSGLLRGSAASNKGTAREGEFVEEIDSVISRDVRPQHAATEHAEGTA